MGKRIGVYQIINILNNHKYIGSSYDIFKRFSIHKNSLKKNKHHSIYLQRAWDKYGEDAFKFEILEECSRDEKVKMEGQYFQIHNPEYNVSKNPLAPMEGRKHSKETLSKMKSARRPKGKDAWCFGKKATFKTREKMKLAHTGSTRNTETKIKMSKTAKKIKAWERMKTHIESLKKKIIDNTGQVFESLSSAARAHKMSVQAVCDILKGRTKQSRKGITFFYV